MSYRQNVYDGKLYEVTVSGPGRMVRYHNKGFRGQSAKSVAAAFANAYPGEGQVTATLKDEATRSLLRTRQAKARRAKAETATCRRPATKPVRSDWRYDD